MRIFKFLFVLLPLGVHTVHAQTEAPKTNRWSVGGFGQYSYDAPFTSSDNLHGLNGDQARLEAGGGLRLKYALNSLFSLDATGSVVNMSGASAIEYYRTQGRFLTIGADYVLRSNPRAGTYKFVPFVRGAVGASDFTATRYFVSDNVAFAESKGEVLSVDLGVGFRYYLNKRLAVQGDLLWSAVNSDAWDGYDDGSGQDVMIRSSLGLAYTFGKGVNRERVAGFKDERVEVLLSDYESMEQVVTGLKKDLAQVKTGINDQGKRVAATQDSFAANLMVELERRYFETQTRKEKAQNMSTVYFEQTGAELSPTYLAAVAAIGKELASDPTKKVSLQAFSDESADASTNERIRRNREKAVLAALLANGANRNQIEVQEWNGLFTGFERFDRRVEIKKMY
jgi:outer membrane protein OmpA-like peptidoglycan-associated protein